MDRRSYLATAATGVLPALSGCIFGGLGVGGPEATSTPVTNGTAPVDGDVPQYQADAANTGVHADARPADEVTTYWRRTPSKYDNSQPVVVDDAVYVSFGGQLVALARETGEPRWTADVGHDGGGAPAVHDGTVYAPAWNGGPGVDRGVTAVAAASGEVLWRGATDLDVGTAPTVTAGGVFVGGGYENRIVTAFDHDGTERWRRELREYASTPAVADGTVYYGVGGSAVVGLDAATGDQRWRRSTDGQMTAPPTVSRDTLLVGSRQGTLYALDVGDGAERWTVDAGGTIRRSPAVTDRRIILPTGDGLVAYDRDGTERWRADELPRSTAPAVAGDAVLFGAGRTLHARSVADGSLRWTFETRERTYTDVVLQGIRAGPAVAGETVFVATQAGDVYALGPA